MLRKIKQLIKHGRDFMGADMTGICDEKGRAVVIGEGAPLPWSLKRFVYLIVISFAYLYLGYREKLRPRKKAGVKTVT